MLPARLLGYNRSGIGEKDIVLSSKEFYDRGMMCTRPLLPHMLVHMIVIAD
jgi:hypothetical protein